MTTTPQPIEKLREMVTACQENAGAHTKNELIEASEGVVELSPADTRLNKGDLIVFLAEQLDETKIIDLDGSTGGPENTDDEASVPDTPVKAEEVPTAEASPPVKRSSRTPVIPMVTVKALVSGVFTVGPTKCKLNEDQEVALPHYAVEHLRARGKVE